jgi:hypothetical protein
VLNTLNLDIAARFDEVAHLLAEATMTELPEEKREALPPAEAM